VSRFQIYLSPSFPSICLPPPDISVSRFPIYLSPVSPSICLPSLHLSVSRLPIYLSPAFWSICLPLPYSPLIFLQHPHLSVSPINLSPAS
jgi:hypothetical protein